MSVSELSDHLNCYYLYNGVYNYINEIKVPVPFIFNNCDVFVATTKKNVLIILHLCDNSLYFIQAGELVRGCYRVVINVS